MTTQLTKPPPWARTALLLLTVVAIGSGCVRRRLTIRSNPPGALVFVDDQEIGTTPVSTSFTYYGSRKIKLIKDGYETLTAIEPISPPWYELPPLDFVSENVVGRELRDERVVEFELQPQKLVPSHELLSRANNLRSGAQQGVLAPAPAPVVPRVVSPDRVPPSLPVAPPASGYTQ